MSQRCRLGLWLLLVLLGSRAALAWLGYSVGQQVATEARAELATDFWGIWARLNSFRYLDIAEHGYFPGYLGPAGWFPGYPLWVRALDWGEGVLPAAVLASNLSLLLAFGCLYALVRLDSPPSTAYRVMALLLAFPSAFLLSSVASESTYLLLSCAAFWAARCRHWRLCAVLAMGATATRLVGLTLLPALLYERRRQGQPLLPVALWLLLSPLAIGLFCLHLNSATGNPWAYFQVQSVVSDNYGVWALWRGGEALWPEHRAGLVFLGLQLLMTALSWQHLRGSYRTYVVLSLLMNVYHTQGLGTQRLMLVLFPLFMGLEAALPKRLYAPVLLLFAAGQAWLFSLWVQGSTLTY